jgi:nucleoside triphosphate diphosphatase
MAGESLAKLVELMAYLRGPEGCPWDREQDFDSLKALLLEEAYEVVDAVNARDFEAVQDELGDLLFQVVFYSRLAQESGRFDIDRVIEHVHAKLVRRHPHVFGEHRAKTAEEALASWRSVKVLEQGTRDSARGQTSLLDGMTPSLPATLEAHEIGTRAAEAGFDWEAPGDILEKIEEEVRELREQISAGASDRMRAEEELGDLLFAASNLARRLHSDPESCLRRANQKFNRRFQALEQEVAGRGKQIRECDARELDEIWELVKSREGR